MTLPVQRPCIVHRCRSYAMPGASRCEPHQREWEAGRWDRGATGSRGSRPGWRALRRRVWAEQGRRCWRCLASVKEFWLHHLDGDATNDPTNGGDRANVVGVCKRCHNILDAEIREGKRARRARMGL